MSLESLVFLLSPLSLLSNHNELSSLNLFNIPRYHALTIHQEQLTTIGGGIKGSFHFLFGFLPRQCRERWRQTQLFQDQACLTSDWRVFLQRIQGEVARCRVWSRSLGGRPIWPVECLARSGPASLHLMHNSPGNHHSLCAGSDPSPEATLYQVPVTPLLAPVQKSTPIPLPFDAET